MYFSLHVHIPIDVCYDSVAVSLTPLSSIPNPKLVARKYA